MKAPRGGTQPMGWVKESILRKQLPMPVIASLCRETQAEGLARQLPSKGCETREQWIRSHPASSSSWGAVVSILHLPRDVQESVRCFQAWEQWGAGEGNCYGSKEAPTQTKVFTNTATWLTCTCWGGPVTGSLIFTESLAVLFSRSTAESKPKLLVISPSCNFLIESSYQTGICLHARRSSSPKTSSINSF